MDMDKSALRQSFTAYLRERFPNDNHVSATVSMAFFLDRHGEEFDIDFKKLLADGSIPASYKRQLEEHFTARGRKNPRGNASVYERSLRLLLEHLNAGAAPITQTRNRSISRPRKALALPVDIPRPTERAVTEYLKKWERLSGYKEQEDALYLLFRSTFPRNANLSEVLLKCSTLNDFYGTNIYGVYPVAKHIVGLDIDVRLSAGDSELVNDIAVGHGMKSKSGKERRLFSFATKYCSHHNPDAYPIYDSYVEKLLIYFRNADGFSDFATEGLRDYPIFKQVIIDFREAYSLQDFNLKQIDQYLWQLGKEKLPKAY